MTDDAMLSSYGPDLKETRANWTNHVDGILKDARPGELPIEEVSKYEVVMNLKRAKALKLTIPDSILLQPMR